MDGERDRRTCCLQVCWFWLVLLFSVSQLSVGIRSASPRGNCCQTESKQKDKLNERGRMKRGSNAGTKRKTGMKQDEEQQSAEIKKQPVILAAAVYPVTAWKDCCLPSIQPCDIQNPISGCVGGGLLSDSGPFVRTVINEEHRLR